MSFNSYKVENKKICESKGWNKLDVCAIWLCLTEEMGELAASVRRFTKIYPDHKKMNIEGEIMDVFSYVLQIADMYNIDLDNLWNMYIKNRCAFIEAT